MRTVYLSRLEVEYSGGDQKLSGLGKVTDINLGMPENESRHMGPSGYVKDTSSSSYHSYQTDDDREADSDTDGDGSPNSFQYENDPHLQLRFADLQKNRVQGMVFGTSQNADIILPKGKDTRPLRPFHCALNFDEQNRLVLRDVADPGPGSKGGTIFTCRGQGRSKRRAFTWILRRDDIIKKHLPILIELDRYLKFKITVAQNDINSVSYQDRAPQFRDQPTARLGPDSLGLSGANLNSRALDSTATQSTTQTPSTNSTVSAGSDLRERGKKPDAALGSARRRRAGGGIARRVRRGKGSQGSG